MRPSRQGGEPKSSGLISVGSGILLSALCIALCEPFFPNLSLKDPGLFFWLVNLFVAYRYGVAAGAASAVVFCGYMAIGSYIPGGAFEHTTRNELRTISSLIIFGVSTLVVGLLPVRFRKESARANEAKVAAEREAEHRRRTEEELRESERLRELVLESSMDAIVAADEAGKVVLWNRHAEAVFGWTSEEAIGRAIDESIVLSLGGDFMESRSESFLALTPGSGSGERIESRVCAKGGRVIEVEMDVVPHPRPQGNILVAFFRDISERKAAEDSIRRLNAELEERVTERTAELVAKNEELEGFSHAISHDIRSPLRSILAHAQMAVEDEGDRISDSGRRHLERVASGALGLSALVDDLLKYAQIGSQALQSEPIDLTLIGEQSKQALLGEYPTAKIEIEPGMTAEGDAMLVRLILDNLIGNACKYTPRGEVPQVAFRSERTDSETIFRVEDQGVGIDMQFAHKLFRPFERLHSASEFPGTGIGLANVRRSIERHGGRVWLDSKLGEGTTVYFTLAPQTS